MIIPVFPPLCFCHAGTLFSSMMFPGRAPENLYLYTTFVGGSRNKELAKAFKYTLTAFALFNPVEYPHYSFNYYFFLVICVHFK